MKQTEVMLKMVEHGGQIVVTIQGGQAVAGPDGKPVANQLSVPQLVAEAMRGLAALTAEFEPKKEGPKLLVAHGSPVMN